MQGVADAKPPASSLTDPLASISNAPASSVDPTAGASAADGSEGPSKPAKKPASKVFRCNGFGDCQMTFTRSEHLARHVRKHTGERPFKCHCGREFSRLDNVRQHASTVHADQQPKNQETIAQLVALHNTLSASTMQRQKDAGMIVQDANGEPRSRKRAEAASGAAEGKPKKTTAKKKTAAAPKKGQEPQPAATDHQAPASEQDAHAQAAATAAAPAPAQPGYPPQMQMAQYTAAAPGMPPPGAYPYGAAGQYPVAQYGAYGQPNVYGFAHPPIHHQQIYGAMPPPQVPYMPPGAEQYYSAAAAAAAAGYPHVPPPHNPYAASSQQQQQQHQQQAQADQSPRMHRPDSTQPISGQPHNRYNPPGPLNYAASTQMPPQPPQDPGALTPNKISLPSISALLPAPFSNGQQQPDVQQQAQLQQTQQAQQQRHGPVDPNVQQQYYAVAAASQNRPPSQLQMPPPGSQNATHAQQPGSASYGAYPGAEMQYQQQQAMSQQHMMDPYARPGSTTGSEREGPPSLSNGSTSATSSNFQTSNGSPAHAHLAAPSQHHSHMYGGAPVQSAYNYSQPIASHLTNTPSGGSYLYGSTPSYHPSQTPTPIAQQQQYPLAPPGAKFALYGQQQPYGLPPLGGPVQPGRESAERGGWAPPPPAGMAGVGAEAR
ncbi:hypothetical protein Rhopal_001715-T1 [Rhodotorula paludigena]|uniref:C2H2-type domain-containing protein n=1 Tax=Rhodotorula paludigena TaxID=86838 RepID=A0AAV5GI42_9BASI|nr:hypothetical protein Rhopal_001715-T1 [Rhodotorula paludigena]